MNDSISRQEVIDALDAICERECEYSKPQRAVMCGACRLGSAFDAVDELPPAERKKGRWVRIEDENGDFLCWECSECRERYVMPYHRASYCPNCGAKMRGEEDE